MASSWAYRRIMALHRILRHYMASYARTTMVGCSWSPNPWCRSSKFHQSDFETEWSGFGCAGWAKMALPSNHLDSGHYLCAHPPGDGAVAAPVEINRAKVREWETFRLDPFNNNEVPAGHGAIAEARATIGPPPLSVAAIVAALHDPNSSVAQIVSSQAPTVFALEELDRLSSSIVNSAPDLERLAALFPDDPWANIALPRLSTWLTQRATGKRHSTPVDRLTAASDAVADRRGTRGPLTIPFMLNFLLRRKVEPQKDVCIVTTIRNEGIYLLEWIAWHRTIGIEHFFVYSNNNTDGSDELLMALANAGVITWLENSDHVSAVPQHKAYGHALSVLPDILDYRWAAIIDADEFIMLNFDKYEKFSDFLEWQEEAPVDAIALNWIFFGANGRKAWTNDLTTRRFTSREPRVSRQIKSVSKVNKFVSSHCHFPFSFRDEAFTFVNDVRQPYQHEAANPCAGLVPSAQNAWVNHYYSRSSEEFIWKKARGYGDRRNDYSQLFSEEGPAVMGQVVDGFRYAQQFIRQENYIKDTRAAQRTPIVEREIAHLLSDPRINAAHAAVIERTLAGMTRAVEAFAALSSDVIPVDIKQFWLNAVGTR